MNSGVVEGMQELYSDHKPAGQVFFTVEFFANGKLENNIKNLAYQKNSIFSSKYGRSRNGATRVPDANMERQFKVSNSMSSSGFQGGKGGDIRSSRSLNRSQEDPRYQHDGGDRYAETRYKTLYDDYGEDYFRHSPEHKRYVDKNPSMSPGREQPPEYTHRDNSLINKFLKPKNTMYESKLTRSGYDRNSYHDDHNDPYQNPYHQQETMYVDDRRYQSHSEHHMRDKFNNVSSIPHGSRSYVDHHVVVNPEHRYNNEENVMYHSINREINNNDNNNNNPYANAYHKKQEQIEPNPFMRGSNEDPFDYNKSTYFITTTHPHQLKRPSSLSPIRKDEDPYRVPDRRDPNDTFSKLVQHRKTPTPSILKDIRPGDELRSPPRDRFNFDDSYKPTNTSKVDNYTNTLNRIEQLKTSGGFKDVKFDLTNSIDPYIYFRQNSTQIFQYAIRENRWKTLPNLKGFYFPKHFSTAQLPDNSYFITGGELNDITLNTTHYYDSGNIVDLAHMISARKGHNSIYHDGFVYVFGGFYDEKSIIKDCERYNFKTKQWTPIARMNFAKAYCTPFIYGNKFIYLIGGFSSTTQFEGVSFIINL
jgi:hypothetical protein